MVQATAQSAKEAIDTLPGPKGVPLLGNLLQCPPTKLHQVLEAWAFQYGPLFRFRMGPMRVVGLGDAELIEELLRKRPAHVTRFRTVGEVFRELGIDGLFPAEGERWQRHRRVWMHAMNVHQVRPFFAQMAEITDRLRKRWVCAAQRGESIDLVSDLMRYTVDVVTLFAYGYDGDTIEGGYDVIQQHLQHVFPTINKRVTMPVAYWRYFPLPADRKLARALPKVRAFAQQRIEETRERMQANPSLREAPENLLEGLIAASEAEDTPLSDEEIYGNTIVALLAGEDTTSLAIGWTVHELIRHPDVLENARAEVDSVLGDAALWQDHESESAFSYLGAVISESMRLRSPTPVNSATAVEDIELGGQTFPAGTNFSFSVRTSAMDERYFEDPLQYRPERWQEANQKPFVRQPPFSFGVGKRSCPGMNLAMLEIKSVLTMLLRNFELHRPVGAAEVEEEFNFAMHPKHLRVQLKPRNPALVEH